MEQISYNYIYLNPLKPGKYSYDGLNFSFLYEPFYVGKGKKNRYLAHLSDAEFYNKQNFMHKTYKINLINKIHKHGYNCKDFICRFNLNSSDQFVREQEILIIKKIGRYNLGLGPLTNLTDGGDGFTNILITE